MREIPRPSLAERTTLRLGGTAIAELVLEDAADLAAALRAEYDVDEPTALQDAQAFLDALRQLNIV